MSERKFWEKGAWEYLESTNYSDDDEYLDYWQSHGLDSEAMRTKNWFNVPEKEK